MIFATCGAAGGEIPFHRMMEALSVLPPDELYVQHGRATPPPCARADVFLPFGRIVELMEAHLLVADGVHDYRLSTMQREGHQAWE